METLRAATFEIAPGIDPAVLVTLVVSLIIFALAMLGMAVGLVLSGRPLMGSCGGIACRRACAGGGESCSHRDSLVQLPESRSVD